MRVLVGMSGGTDSSVAAALLKNQGYAVVGATMSLWRGQVAPRRGRGHGCYGPEEEQDIEEARRDAGVLGIPFHILDLAREYESEVLEYFRREYLTGRTPNQCIRCNRQIKFDARVKKARASGIEFDYLASGHYARTEDGNYPGPGAGLLRWRYRSRRGIIEKTGANEIGQNNRCLSVSRQGH